MGLPEIDGPFVDPEMIIYRGSVFTRTYNFTDSVTGDALDFTDLTGRGQIRHAFSDVAPEVAFTVVVDPAGSITISLTTAQTTGLTLPQNLGQRIQDLGDFDIEVVDGLEAVRIVEGKVKLSLDATQ